MVLVIYLLSIVHFAFDEKSVIVISYYTRFDFKTFGKIHKSHLDSGN